MIGLLCYVLLEVTVLYCCVRGSQPGVVGMMLSIGLMLPEFSVTFKAAIKSKYADAIIGNLLGINTCTILLGMGLPWLIATSYYDNKNVEFGYQHPKGAGMLFALGAYMVLSAIGLIVLLIRRFCGGELGGNVIARRISGLFMLCLYLIFILLVCL